MDNEAFHSLFAACQGTINRGCFVEKVYSSKFKRVVVFAECAQYRFGLPLDPSDCLEDAEEDRTLQAAYQRAFTKAKEFLDQRMSQTQRGEQIAYHMFIDALKHVLNGADFLIFRFGQKQPLSQFYSSICTIETLHIEVAIAVEFAKEHAVVYPSLEKRNLSEHCYGVLLSTSVGSLLFKNSDADDIVPKAYRLCVYNTSEHMRKKAHSLK